MRVLAVSWTGCPAVLACLHYLDAHPRRVGVLCKACSRALAKRGGWRKPKASQP